LRIYPLLLAVTLASACEDQSTALPPAPTQADGVPGTMLRATAESVYSALLDSLRNAYGDVPEYVALEAPRLNRAGFFDTLPSPAHRPWALAVLTRHPRIHDVCDLTTAGECPKAPGLALVYRISPLYRWRSTDTVLVAVSQSTTWPPGSPEVSHYP